MSSFGGTVKLTGESEYRAALKEISSNMKVLNSELKAATSAYDKNDKSVENLTAQNTVLNKKIEEQENKVSILKQALEKSKEETGENSETTKKWQTELNNAQAELNKLNREVKENADEIEKASKETGEIADDTQKMATASGLAVIAMKLFGKTMDEMGEETKETGEEEEKTAEKTLKLSDIIKANLISDAIKAGLSALVDGFKAMGSALGDCLTSGAAYADNMLTLSAQTGLSTDTLEKYNAVAELADVSMETFTGSLAKTTKAMGEAQKGSTKYVEAYKQLGVSVTDANGNLRDSEDVYWETVDALKGIQNETERDALAMELFGKKAQDLNTIIDMGSEGFKELEKTAVDMGAVLGGEGLAALGALDDQMQIFSSTTDATKNILASAFAPAMAGALESVNGLAGSFNGLIAAILSGDEGGIETAMTMVSEQVTAMVENLSAILPELGAIAMSLISTLLDVISQNLPLILSEGANLLRSLLTGISSNLGSVLPVILSVVQTISTTILQNLPMILQMGIQVLVSLIEGISSMLPDLIPLCIDTVILLAETLLDNLDLIIDAGIDLVMALAEGLIDSGALTRLVDKIPVIIEKLILTISNNLPKILEAGITILLKVGEGLIKAIPQLVSKVPEIISSLVNGFKNAWGSITSIGTDLVKGIWNGISNATSWILGKIKGFGQSVLNGLKSFFGIHSPSTVFRDQIGTNLALGVGEGFADTMSEVSNEMQNAIPTEFDASVTTNMSANSQMSTYDMMVGAFKKALSEVKVVLDDREMGSFVTDTVERAVFA